MVLFIFPPLIPATPPPEAPVELCISKEALPGKEIEFETAPDDEEFSLIPEEFLLLPKEFCLPSGGLLNVGKSVPIASDKKHYRHSMQKSVPVAVKYNRRGNRNH